MRRSDFMGRRRLVIRLVGALAMVIPGGFGAAVASSSGAGAAISTAESIFHPPMTLVPNISHDNVQSSNWSGYAVSSSTPFTDVVGRWVEPTAMGCASGGTTYGSFWVGLDGYSSNSVEQLGTDSDCSRGTPSYYAWFEMYPAASVTLSRSSYPVKAGDTLTGIVTRSGNSYALILVDNEASGGKWTFSQPETASDANASAEWVAEAPEICFLVFCRQASLTDFGTLTFSGAQAATGAANAPISSFTASGGPHEITMVTSTGTIKAQPSSLAAGGEGFTDTWYHS